MEKSTMPRKSRKNFDIYALIVALCPHIVFINSRPFKFNYGYDTGSFGFLDENNMYHKLDIKFVTKIMKSLWSDRVIIQNSFNIMSRVNQALKIVSTGELGGLKFKPFKFLIKTRYGYTPFAKCGEDFVAVHDFYSDYSPNHAIFDISCLSGDCIDFLERQPEYFSKWLDMVSENQTIYIYDWTVSKKEIQQKRIFLARSFLKLLSFFLKRKPIRQVPLIIAQYLGVVKLPFSINARSESVKEQLYYNRSLTYYDSKRDEYEIRSGEINYFDFNSSKV